MRRQPLRSTSITSVGYDHDDEVLEVDFHTGRVYAYRGVPAHLHQELLAAPSVGAFVAHRIKPHYPATQVG